MPITDLDVLGEIQPTLQEDAGFSNGLWTFAEVVGYLNQRQQRFLKATKIIGVIASVPWVPHTDAQPLPADWIATLDVLWHDTLSNVWTPLPASDSWELDHVDAGGATTPRVIPSAYRDGDVNTLTIMVGPAPENPGDLDLLYVPLGTTFTGLGIEFVVPDDWVPYVKYGVLADMFGKDGRGQDLLRARYCETRFEEGIALALSLLGGW